jgi:hypothetical protein
MKRNINLLVCLFTLIILSYCKREDDFGVKLLDFREVTGEKYDLSDLTDEIEVVPLHLPDTITLGKIQSVRYFEPYWIMHDPDLTQSIYLFDESGRYINTLQRIGEGPGEYLTLSAYLVIENSIAIYDRALRRISWYSYPEFEFVRDEKAANYYLDLLFLNEFVNAFAISDDLAENSLYEGIIYLDKDLESVKKSAKPSGVIELTQTCNISFTGNKYFYAEPLTEIVYQIDSLEMKPFYKIDFGKFGLPDRSKEIEEAEDFYELLQKGNYAFAIHNFNIKESMVSFNFYHKSFEVIKLGLYDLNLQKMWVVNEITKENFLLRLLNVSAGYNINILYPDEYDENMLENLGVNLDKIIPQNQTPSPLLLKYKWNKIPNS